MEPQHYDRENDIKPPAGLPPPKGAINPGVVDLGAPLVVPCNRQLLPLTSQVQQFQDVVEQGACRDTAWRRGRDVQSVRCGKTNCWNCSRFSSVGMLRDCTLLVMLTPKEGGACIGIR